MKPNEGQQQVINQIYGQVIAIACPGSGKTTTLLERINHMVVDEHIDPTKIIMITFSKAAAKEMGERFKKKYDKNSKVVFSTIHSFCFSLLRSYKGYKPEQLILNNYQILWKYIVQIKRIDAKDRMKFLQDLQNDISIVKSNPINREDYEPKSTTDKVLFEQLYQTYEKEKKENYQIDFDDLLLHAYYLLKTDKEVLADVRERYQFIHVDEYQDVNYLQRNIIYLLAGQNGNLTVVGDDDQSIYQFRGAKPEIMLRFQKDYPNATAVYLDTNYRSGSDILKKAKNLIEHNHTRFAKDIKPFHKEKGKVLTQRFYNEEQEMDALGQMIEDDIEKGVDLNEMAVLARTNIELARVAELLLQLKIPFYSNEKIFNRYQSFLFDDIMAYEKIARGLGVGSDYMKTLKHPNRFLPLSFDEFKQADRKYMKCLKIISRKMQREAYWKQEKCKERVYEYFEVLDLLKNECLTKGLQALYSTGKYSEYLEDYANFRGEDFAFYRDVYESFLRDIEKKGITNLEEWQQYAMQYTRFLEKKKNERKGVCLSTMHGAKGLEWERVYILNLVDGRVPYVKAVEQGMMEEERRLFYVALTRAKKEANLLYYRRNSKGQESLPSEFLVELNE